MPGSRTSRNTTSGGCLRAFASPSSAVAATATRYFSRSNARRSAQAIGSSSSMIRTECGMDATTERMWCGTASILHEASAVPCRRAAITYNEQHEHDGAAMTRMLATLMTALAAPPPTAADPPKVEIVAHRGASFDAPENTVAAIKLAWEQKADAAEFDVFLSKDGKIVVIHDADTKRTAGVDRKVADTTLEELRKLDVGKWKDAKFAGEKIPTLEEMLATVPAGKRVFIEVKCGPEIVPELDRVLKASEAQAGADARDQLQCGRGRGGEEGPPGPAGVLDREPRPEEGRSRGPRRS